MAIRHSLHKKYALLCLYPSSLQPRELTELIPQRSAPFIIVDDFNAHNPLLGGDKVIGKGKIVEDVISYHNLCILNDGSNTYSHPGNDFYFSIDLTIIEPSLLLDLHWAVHDD